MLNNDQSADLDDAGWEKEGASGVDIVEEPVSLGNQTTSSVSFNTK